MKNKLFMTIATAATLLSACSQEDTPWNGELRLSSGVTVQQTRANSADVPDKQIAEGQTVQVIVTEQDNDAGEYAGYDQALTAQGNGTFTVPTDMFYPESGMGVSIYAYHPATAAASFVVNTAQDVDENYFNSDLLYSTKANYGRQSAAHSLSFKHKLSKLTFELKRGTGNPVVLGAEVKWTNVCNTAAFDNATGTVSTPSNPTTITPHATYGTIIVPQTVAAKTALLTVKLTNGGTLTYTPDADQLFEGGKKYHYEITVNLTGLEVTSTIADWAPIANREGEAVM